MNNNHLLVVITCLFLSLSSVISAQNTYQAGLLPSINLNRKLKNDWSVNFKIESRQLLQEGTFNGKRNRNYEYILTDNALIAAKKVGLNAKISGGYLIRLRSGNTIHRLIQQYTIAQKLPRFRLAHRFVTDQTFTPDEPTEYRLRYRLAIEIPLNGESADPKEMYLKINNEYLNSLEDSDYDLEIRLVPLLGYRINTNYRIELGLDYRVNSFLNDNAQHRFWTSINWFVVL